MPENENLQGDAQRINEIQKFLLEALDAWLKDHPTRDIDVFLAAHNFHRFIVQSMSTRWEPGVPAWNTLRMADLTFRKAMRDLR